MRALPVLLLTVPLAGCASQARLASDYATMQQELAIAHGVSPCRPVDLAQADANAAFAELEFQQGDTRRAAEHVALARQGARSVATCAPIAVPPPEPVRAAPQAVTQVAAAAPAAPAATPPMPAPSSDADRDGIVDADDKCPRDPEDLDGFKDSDGCSELDNDLDGVSDLMDRCASDAEDRDGFEDADGCPDLDNDRDGVADAQDRCPTDRGTMADGGCPVYDKDSDGVGDSFDRCPVDAETKNGYLDEDGCPDAKPQRVEITGEAIVIKQRINFATGKATILQDSFVVLDDVAQVLKDYPQLKVEIGGHTDNQGDDAANQRLSKGRADAVFEYLLSKGVAATRMFTVGYGETRPVDTNMTDAGRMANRRVEFLIVSNIDPRSPTGVSPAPVAPAAPAEATPWGGN
jgi:outer membrane protein OmpA-like peptidoglycan-associated protein